MAHKRLTDEQRRAMWARMSGVNKTYHPLTEMQKVTGKTYHPVTDMNEAVKRNLNVSPRKGLSPRAAKGDAKVHKHTSYSVEDFDLPIEPIQDSIDIEETDKGFTVKYLAEDSDPESPREWDNLGHMACFHKRYDLGDKQTEFKSEDYGSWSEMQADIIKKEKPIVILPLYLYDHSGLRMKVGSFQGLLPQGHAEFDSGQVGFIYATKKDVDKMGLTDRSKAEIAKQLEAEVEEYDQYLSGDVYGIVRVDFDKDKKEIKNDAVWGFYGSKNATEALKTEI